LEKESGRGNQSSVTDILIFNLIMCIKKYFLSWVLIPEKLGISIRSISKDNDTELVNKKTRRRTQD